MSTTRFMRAKMSVLEVHRSAYPNGQTMVYQDRIKLAAVAAKAYPADGSDEDNTYARFSPSGELTLTIANPSLIGRIEPGTTFYVDFIPVEGGATAG